MLKFRPHKYDRKRIRRQQQTSGKRSFLNSCQ
jgi:hypothetical protein